MQKCTNFCQTKMTGKDGSQTLKRTVDRREGKKVENICHVVYFFKRTKNSGAADSSMLRTMIANDIQNQ